MKTKHVILVRIVVTRKPRRVNHLFLFLFHYCIYYFFHVLNFSQDGNLFLVCKVICVRSLSSASSRVVVSFCYRMSSWMHESLCWLLNVGGSWLGFVGLLETNTPQAKFFGSADEIRAVSSNCSYRLSWPVVKTLGHAEWGIGLASPSSAQLAPGSIPYVTYAL